MNKIVISLILLITLCGCSSSQNKDKMFARHIQLYKDSPAWELAQAVENEDTILIKELCKKDTSLLRYQETKFGQTLLEWAVYTNHFKSTKVLAECGANPNIQSYNGTTAFIHAAEKHETSDYIKLLLKYGGDVNAIAKPKDKNDEPQQLRTPLIAAAWCNLESVKILVEAGADINYVDSFEQSALHNACLGNQIEIIQYLIQKGVNYKNPLTYDNEKHPLYVQHFMRDMVFPLDSKEYKIKMEVVDFLKKNGMNYWETEIPPHLFNNYSKEYLEKY